MIVTGLDIIFLAGFPLSWMAEAQTAGFLEDARLLD
jgi:hypothetical protein